MGLKLVDSIALPATFAAPIRAVLEDPRFHRYVALVAPSSALQYAGGVYVVPAHLPRTGTGGWPWRCLRGRPTDLKRLLAVHILAGVFDEPQRYASGYAAVLRAVGLGTPTKELVAYASIDLDGHRDYPPAAVVAALRERYSASALLVTSSSGREGRFRAFLRLVAPMPWPEMVRRVEQVLVESNFPPVAGGVEVYPCGKNSRLPFGLGGCSRYDDEVLADGRKHHPLDLSEMLCALSPIDLPTMSSHLAQRRPSVVRAASLTSKPAGGTSLSTTGLREASGVHTSRSSSLGDVARWWASGVDGPGERDAAIWALIRDCRERGVSQASTLSRMRRWIDDGGLDRSRAGRSPREVATHRRDLSRRVADAYRRASDRRPPALHLTPREVIDAAVRSEMAAADPREAGVIFAMLLGVLPMFKALVASGIPHAALPHEWWRKRGGERCAILREAVALFVRVEPHRAQREFGDEAHSARWTTTFAFDRESPNRSVLPARSSGQTPGCSLLQARLLVTRAVPRDLRRRVAVWQARTRSEPYTSVDEAIWFLLRDAARKGASGEVLWATLRKAISAVVVEHEGASSIPVVQLSDQLLGDAGLDQVVE